jgi:ubiquinone/menaquinone biosynthesis C-methylase UbiE
LNFHENSYDSHEKHLEKHTQDTEKIALSKTWACDDTVDAWRHKRMYNMLLPIIKYYSAASWVTIGDGRYGTDAHFLKIHGCAVMATDIGTALLEKAKQEGFINDFKKENAERLSFQDNAFDFVLCKESYHHFPRPMIALYEMLRVAKQGVVLIEPYDAESTQTLFRIMEKSLKNRIKRFIGKPIIAPHTYEEVGNYIYSISRREMEKAALGLNYTTIFFKGINDFYMQGCEYEKMSAHGHLQKKIYRRIMLDNMRCKLGLRDYGLLFTLILKEKPSEEFIQSLLKERYEIVHLPANPYLGRESKINVCL